MLIFIIGYMGAGKTTLGKKLAAKLGYHFIDLDEEITADSKCTVAEYFEWFGEEAFRQQEREILIKLPDNKDTVIATGGGTPCFEDNMDLMNKKGVTVFLDADVDTILARIKEEIIQRPLLKDIPVEKLPAFIKEHLESRRKYYSKANFSITPDDCDIDGLLKRLK